MTMLQRKTVVRKAPRGMRFIHTGEYDRLKSIEAALDAEYDAVGLSDGQRTPATLVRHWKGNAGLTGYLNGMLDERTGERAARSGEIDAMLDIIKAAYRFNRYCGPEFDPEDKGADTDLFVFLEANKGWLERNP